MTENQKKPPPLHIPSCRWLPQRGGMWRVVYSVSPRTPEGGQAGKGDKLPSLHIHSCRWLSSREKCGNQREAIGGVERLKRGEPKTKRAILTLAKFEMKKRCVGTVRSFRKETEEIRRRL